MTLFCGRPKRTFAGSNCAICEEPIQHTLQGERIRQLSCLIHVSHEICFQQSNNKYSAKRCPGCNIQTLIDSSKSSAADLKHMGLPGSTLLDKNEELETPLQHHAITGTGLSLLPTIEMRTEFPYYTKSRWQQSLTCLVTIKVARRSGHAKPSNMRVAPQQYLPSIKEGRFMPSGELDESKHWSEMLNRENASRPLEGLHEKLVQRVKDWHGLDHSQFGSLLLHGTLRAGKDKQSWQVLNCYLFAEILICVKAKTSTPLPSQGWDGSIEVEDDRRYVLKSSISTKKHLQRVEHLHGMA